jgi:hypothetical protein
MADMAGQEYAPAAESIQGPVMRAIPSQLNPCNKARTKTRHPSMFLRQLTRKSGSLKIVAA